MIYDTQNSIKFEFKNLNKNWIKTEIKVENRIEIELSNNASSGIIFL